jgi:hypothetical protein|tara:strand:- start:101 stop:418 length:318 start_codon:yes stop_codon:yes gene_type:complete
VALTLLRTTWRRYTSQKHWGLGRDELVDSGGQAFEPHSADAALYSSVIVDEDECWLGRNPELAPNLAVRIGYMVEPFDSAISDPLLERVGIVATGNTDHGYIICK